MKVVKLFMETRYWNFPNTRTARLNELQ